MARARWMDEAGEFVGMGIGSIWGPIGRMVGKEAGKRTGGAISALTTGENEDVAPNIAEAMIGPAVPDRYSRGGKVKHGSGTCVSCKGNKVLTSRRY